MIYPGKSRRRRFKVLIPRLEKTNNVVAKE